MGFLSGTRPEAGAPATRSLASSWFDPAGARVNSTPRQIASFSAPWLVDLLLLVVVSMDRLAGRVHPLWLLGGAALVSIQYLRVAVVPTQAWRDFTFGLAAPGA